MMRRIAPKPDQRQDHVWRALGFGVVLHFACGGGSFSTTGIPEPLSHRVAAGAAAHGGTAAARAACSDLRPHFSSNGSPQPTAQASISATFLMAAPTRRHRIAGTLSVVAGSCSRHSDEEMRSALKDLATEVGCDALLPPVLVDQRDPTNGEAERHLQSSCVVYVISADGQGLLRFPNGACASDSLGNRDCGRELRQAW